MTDSLYLDEVAGFLRSLDDPTIPGHELLLSLDKEESLLSLQGTEIALQMLDVTPVDDLFITVEDSVDGNRDHHTDSDCTSAESESVASTSSPPVVVESIRSRDAIRRSTYRQKQKAEKDELYRQVEELSSQLSMLQKNKEDAEVSRGTGLAQTALWKALATRHMQGRLIAEEQRRRLCEAVERRSALIRDLGVIIRKRISEEQPEEEPAAKKPRTESPDMALYQAYMSELDEVYARTDGIFKDTSAQREAEECDESPGYFSVQRKVENDSRYHELVGKSTTPFAYDRVQVYIDRACCMENRMGRELIEGASVPENTTIVKARVNPAGFAGSLVQHTVRRKYAEADRIVVVSRKFTEGDGAFSGMQSDETGWSIVRPSPSCVKGGAGTLLESVTRFVPINFSSASSSGVTVKQFAAAIIKAGEENCQSCIQQLEMLLLNDALGVC
uniref:START domain-containing protein n=3 Tax=Phytophthora fragariae TaxID=53985 RepID=A0A6A3ED19_9STRA|nr:hypothetical protein PF009_g18482 [Phytophthora fragariae]